MSQRVEKLLAVAFVVVLVATAWATTYFAGSDESAEERGAAVAEARREAPDFTLPLLSGPDFVLSEHRGQILIVDFWATWCGPCEVQMPVLNALWKHQHEGRGDLMILGISVDTDPVEKVSAWLEERDLDYPIAIGDQDLAMRYGVIGYPTLFVIDPNGVIRLQHVGVLSRPELEDILDEIRQEHLQEG
jgi:thiol-disulfide isomerase/thioredoxin